MLRAAFVTILGICLLSQMDDPDAVAVTGRVFDHWVLYDLPAETRQPEGIPTHERLADGSVHDVTTRKTYGYFSPRPPKGTHRYFFKLFALARRLGLEPGKTKDEILQAIERHIFTSAELVGLYTRETIV